MDRMMAERSLSRVDIEAAADRYFSSLITNHGPLEDVSANPADTTAYNLEMNAGRLEALDFQFQNNKFDGEVEATARAMLRAVGFEFDSLAPDLAKTALTLAARLERQELRLLSSRIERPGLPFQADDPVFDQEALNSPMGLQAYPPTHGSQPVGTGRVQRRERLLNVDLLDTIPMPFAGMPQCLTLGQAVAMFLINLEDQGYSVSKQCETKRVLGWLTTEFGPETSLGEIQIHHVREFRELLGGCAKTRTGQTKRLREHQTADPLQRIKGVTHRRYFYFVKNLFEWALQDGYISLDPAATLDVKVRRGEKAKSPDSFSPEEVRQFFNQPVFQGRQSSRHRFTSGNYRVRDGHWWSAVLQAFSGTRAGEISQLLASDFSFEGEIPFFWVREEDEGGASTKSIKTEASRRAIPIAPALIALGIREFVEARKKRNPHGRLFDEFPLGASGKKSAGMSKFWSRYLRSAGLHKPGRSTHVWRHTVAGQLRSAGVYDVEIAYLLGQTAGQGQPAQTTKYGADASLIKRVYRECTLKLDYGFDPVELLGGPYVKKIHGE